MIMMHLIDSHCHLDFPDFDTDRNHILQQCQHLGINHIIIPATVRSRWPGLLALCEQSPLLYPALGLHPMFMHEHQSDDIAALEQSLTASSPIAIGEIGLDFYINDADKTAQIELFTAQIKLAERFQLPVILHVRKAHDEVLKILRQHSLTGGIVHAFNGSQQQAEHYMQQGFVFGVGGAITYSRASKLRRLFSELPLDHILLETDAPDMPLFGQIHARNSPLNLPVIMATLIQLRPESEQQLAEAMYATCQRLFKHIDW